MGMIIFDLHGGCTLYLNVWFIPQFCLQKEIKSNLNVHQLMRSVIAFSLHISNSTTNPAGLDFYFSLSQKITAEHCNEQKKEEKLFLNRNIKM
jgi:hypothetical protein